MSNKCKCGKEKENTCWAQCAECQQKMAKRKEEDNLMIASDDAIWLEVEK